MVKRALLAFFFIPLCGTLLPAETPARGEQVSIPSGTMLHCRTTQTLTTKLNFQGDTFTASVAEPVLVDGHEAIPAGATLEGRIALMERPGRIKGVGIMRLTAERITLPDGRSFPLGAMLLTAYGAENAQVVGSEGIVKGPSSRGSEVKEIGAGTAAGGVLGLIFHHPWIGAAVGGTAGFVDRLRRRGKDLTIPAGTQLNYQLTRPLELTGENPRQTASRRPGRAGGE
jgi:hypothetical protein